MMRSYRPSFRGSLLLSISLVLSISAATASALPPQPKHAEISKAVINTNAVHAGDKGLLAVVLDIKNGFHAQSRTPLDENLIKFDIAPDNAALIKFGEAIYPAGKIEEYGDLGKLSVYTGQVIVRIPFEVAPDAKAGDLKITGKLRYQICDDKACYPPEGPKFEIPLKVLDAGGKTEPAESELFPPLEAARSPTTAAATGSPVAAAAPPPVDVGDNKPRWGIFAALGAAFVAGILFNIVPCVLPVLPIKVLGFAEVAQHNRGKTIALASVFGLGIVSVFAILGILILGVKTIGWGQQFSNPYFAWGIIILLLVLSLWLFGVLNFNLPSSAYAFTPRHDTWWGNYLWGILTAVLSTPCTGPLFPPLLLWAQQAPPLIGINAMMMVGVGMASPYVVLSAFPEVARKFPRVGPWAELFKQMLGFVLLGFTFFFAAGRFTHPAGQWWAAVPVAVMAALYLMARTVQLTKDARPVAIASFLSVAIVSLSVLVACRFSGVFDGATDAGSARTVAVSWTPYSDSALEAARKAGKITLIKFTANWCLNCQYVDATVYHDGRTVQALHDHDVVTLKADLTEDNAAGWPRLRDIAGKGGIPLTAIYAPGYEKPVQIASVYTTDTLINTLNQLAAAKTAMAQ